MKTKSVTKFKWNPNGMDHINCPGGFVLCNYDPRNLNPLDIKKHESFRFVLYHGHLVQICSTKKSAKEWIIDTMRWIYEEYRDAR